MRTVWLVGALAGCRFAPDAAQRDAAVRDDARDAIDAAVDAAIDAPIGQLCFGTASASLFTQCFASDQVPMNTVTLTTRVFDTVTDCTGVASVQTSHAIQACVIAAKTITISGVVTVHGARPLVLLATGTLTVAAGGTLDASSNHAGDGPNAGATACNPGGPGGNFAGGGGGGAGGSFGTQGGDGGSSGLADNGGTAVVLTAATTLRGGCSGAKGGDGNANNHGGAGGHAGGAVYLIGGVAIHIAGKVYASGAGGVGGDATAGGGGAGTGGLIGFDAPSVAISSATVVQPEVIANGGAGGGGGGDGNRERHPPAATASCWSSTPGAIGGMPGMSMMSSGGEGGGGTNWASTSGVFGAGGDPGDGGGGGGGGYGVIWVVGSYTNTNGDVSPMTPSVH